MCSRVFGGHIESQAALQRFEVFFILPRTLPFRCAASHRCRKAGQGGRARDLARRALAFPPMVSFNASCIRYISLTYLQGSSCARKLPVLVLVGRQQRLGLRASQASAAT